MPREGETIVPCRTRPLTCSMREMIGGPAASTNSAPISSFHLFVILFLPIFSVSVIALTSGADAVVTSVAVGKLWESGGNNTFNFSDGSKVSLILVNGTSGMSFACGFFCRDGCETILFSVFLVDYGVYGNLSAATPPQLVWSAQRNGPVQGGKAVLNLTMDGLHLVDSSGELVWSTNTYDQNVVLMSLTEAGNLVLISNNSQTVWQSYSYPTDTALPGQRLIGLNLIASASADNATEVPFFVTVHESYFTASISDNGVSTSPAQMYYRSDDHQIQGGILLPVPTRGRSLTGSTPYNATSPSRRLITPISRPLSPYHPTSPPTPRSRSPLATDSSTFPKVFVRLEADGRLRRYEWRVDSSGSYQWEQTDDLMKSDRRGNCKYPKECNLYGVCDVEEAQCSCPGAEQSNYDQYFVPQDPLKLNKGCRQVKPWSCGQHQRFARYDDIAYFGYVNTADIPNTDVENCKLTCLSRSCSCQAAFFRYDSNLSHGDCYLPSAIYSLIQNNVTVSRYNSTAFIKVLDDDKSGRRWLAVEISVPVICFFVLLSAYIYYRRRQRLPFASSSGMQEGDGEDDKFVEGFKFEHLPGMPTKFSFDEIQVATEGFSKKLGEGGFGPVFHGTLIDGTQVAVKILGYKGQGLKEFLAEVETIGSIHHLNLVRLVGYCADRHNRQLVYEYLSNGSLDKWIFHDEKHSSGRGAKHALDFATKYRIILHVARGLSYLHHDCRHRIIHLDIKPENILLDASFNAKVSDFGLSKLVDRDESQVVTTLRGTPGYLAPEWLNSIITEKVDVYSFGVVVLETVSGKRILDYSRSGGSINLVGVLSKAAEKERLSEIIGEENVDEEEAMRLVKVAMSCLQGDYTKRPSMSTVVKVLEGLMEVEPAVEGLWVSTPASSMSTITSDGAGGSSMSTFTTVRSGR